jgi:hypothetical protein
LGGFQRTDVKNGASSPLLGELKEALLLVFLKEE